MNLPDVAEAAVHHFGAYNQMRQAQEECAELVTAINHFIRSNTDETRLEVINEIADVRIMIEQLAQIFGPENVKTAMDFKLSALKEIIDVQCSRLMQHAPSVVFDMTGKKRDSDG